MVPGVSKHHLLSRKSLLLGLKLLFSSPGITARKENGSKASLSSFVFAVKVRPI
jgi:hypothetical protein